MRIVERKVYNFEELEENMQKKLIEKEIEYQQEAYCESFLKEDMEEKAKELLKKYFKNKANFISVCYSLSYCQGDGAMIEFNLNYYNKILKIKQHGFYYHERSFEIVNNYEITEKQERRLKAKIVAMNEELGNYGYELIEGAILTEEKAKELLKEHEYYINGEIYL